MTPGERREELPGAAAATGLEIAVIGMAGRFPGAADITGFWENLKNGVETIGYFSPQELEEADIDPGLLDNPSYIKAFGFLADEDYFDAGFFGYTPGEAQLLLPHTRIYQQCVWEALEDAAIDPDSVDSRIGIYAGASPSTYWEMLTLLKISDSEVDDLTRFILTNKDSMSTGIAYRLNLTGPAVVVQTACSTSLVAVHLAIQGLLNGECEMALAGGVNISVSGKNGYLYQEGMIGSADGHVRAFDARANGAVGGNGAAVVVLKPLAEALADHDHIYALIKGSAINNDGTRKVGYTAPSVEGQTEVIKAAQYLAEVEPESIGYMEAHGTATKLGDPVEIEALKAAFETDKKGFCAIGSVKTNVGHLDNAAGTASLIKAVLALYHKFIPPSLHFETANPHIDFENSPFYVVTRACEWKPHDPKYPLRAGVSSFGIGGTNAHVVLEEWSHHSSNAWRTAHGAESKTQSAECQAQSAGREYQLILLSAKTNTALDRMTRNLAEYFQHHLLNHDNQKNPLNPGLTLADAAYTLQIGRKTFPYRRMLVCARDNIVEAAAALTESSGAKVHTYTPAPGDPDEKNRKTRVIFMFPGQGAQYVNMGRELYETEPYFRQEMNRCFEILKPLMGHDIKEILYPYSDCRGGSLCPPKDCIGSLGQGDHRGSPLQSDRINQTEIAQPLLFAIEYALAKLLIKWGIKPAAMIGHSIGEYTAACLAGVFSLADALELVVLRGKLMQQRPWGTMLSISISEERLKPLLAANKEISLAAVNTPSRCVVAGINQDMEEFETWLKQQDNQIQMQKLHTSHAFHSKMMEPILDEFGEKIRQKQFPQPWIHIPFISNLTGAWMTLEDAVNPGYWVQHLRQPVRFARGLSQLLTIENAICIEVGPGRTLSSFVNQHPDKKVEQKVIHSMRHPGDDIPDVYFLYQRVGQLWLYGQPIDWFGFYGEEEKQRRRISLPTYPFEPQCFRLDDSDLGQDTLANILGKSGSTPGFADWFYIPTWMQQILLPSDDFDPEVHDNWLVFIDQCGLGQQLVKRLKEKGHEVITLEPGSEFVKRNPQSYMINPQQSQDYHRLFNDLAARSIPSRVVHLWGVTGTRTASMDIEGFEKVQDWGFYSLLYTARAIGSIVIERLNRQIQINVVTNHVQEVTGEEPLCPAKAVVTGLARVIPQELPGIRCRSIDVLLPEPGSEKEKKLPDQLLEEISLEPIEPLVAYRGNSRWVQTFHPLRLDKTRENLLKAKLKENGVYLVTGGTGNIGLMLAEYLAKKVKARLILTARSWVPAREQWEQWLKDHDESDPCSQKIQRIKALEQWGAQVWLFSVDAADKDLMQQVITRVEGKWGPINGIIHAAGGMKDQSLKSVQELEKPDCEKQFQAKVKGLIVLAELFQGKEPDFYFLLSSISTVLGGLGFAAYAAANRFMDAFAREQERSHPGKWISVDWDRMDQEKTQLAFERILALGKAIPVVVSTGGNLQQRINRWVKLEFLAEEKKINKKEVKFLTPRPVLTNRYVPPRGYFQQTLASMWQDLFGFDRVGIQDDFFELGGDSLKAMTIIGLIHNKLNVKLSLAEFFKRPNIKELSCCLEGAEQHQYTTIPRAPLKDYYPLSSAQKRIYIIRQMQPEGIVFNEFSVMEMQGELDREKLTDTFQQLIRRHESLRTSFQLKNEEPVQKIHQEVEFEIECFDFKIDPVEVEVKVKEKEGTRGLAPLPDAPLPIEPAIRGFIRPFDLSQAPLLRVGLMELPHTPAALCGHPRRGTYNSQEGNEHQYIMIIDTHHIISDGTSMGIFIKEFMAVYAGETLPPLTVTYKDYSEWQNSETGQEIMAQQETYWLQQFQGPLPRLNLPIDYPRPAIQSFQGNTRRFEIDGELSEALIELALKEETSLFMVMFAIFNVLLWRLSRQKDIIVGTPIAGRRHPELQQVIGMFVNTLALKVHIKPRNTFKEFLAHISQEALQAFENQDYQFEDLVNQLETQRPAGRNPIFDVMFEVNNVDNLDFNIPGFSIKSYDSKGTVSRFDLTLKVFRLENVISFTLTYCTALFKEETIVMFIDIFLKLLDKIPLAVDKRLSEIEVLSQTEKAEALAGVTDDLENE